MSIARQISAFLVAAVSVPCLAVGLALSGTVFEAVGEEAGIDPILLYAVAIMESGFRPSGSKVAFPYPWTLQANGPFYGATLADAQKRLTWLLTRIPDKNIDVGLLQISLKYHGHRVNDYRDLLDPLTNVRIGASILAQELARSPGDPVAALGRYHSGSRKDKSGYGKKVWNIYRTLKADTPDRFTGPFTLPPAAPVSSTVRPSLLDAQEHAK